MTNTRSFGSRFLVASACAAILGLAQSCSTSTSRGSDASTMTIALTDAASDEISSFAVDITSVRLEREDDAVTELLASPSRVDLATLADVSRVLAVLYAPPALYTTLSVTIDFTHASCVLVGKAAAATLLDGDGNPLAGPITFDIEISGDIPGIAGRHRILELDLDIDGSAEVAKAANKVSFEPILTLRIDPQDPKALALGGRLLSVDPGALTFGAELQTLAGAAFAAVTVDVRKETIYQVGGTTAVGAQGLSALAAAGPGTWVQWSGAIDPEKRRYDATYVEAGIGTYNGGTDFVEGHVTGRIGGANSDATLTVLGTGESADHTSHVSRASFTVVTSFANTSVLSSGSADHRDTDDLNIGQRVRVFGALTGTLMDAAQVVRILPAHVLGFANDPVDAGTLPMDLSRVDLEAAQEFTWSEGGPTPPDPEALTIDVGTLADNLGIAAGTAVDAGGAFAAIDDAEEDFVADSVVNHSLAPVTIIIRDRAEGMTLTPTISATELSLEISGHPAANEVARIDKGFVGSVNLPLHPPLTIGPADGTTIFTIRDRDDGSSLVFKKFADFADALADALGNSALIFDLVAVGVYESGGNTLTAKSIGVVLD
jgi:hypothetical protein